MAFMVRKKSQTAEADTGASAAPPAPVAAETRDRPGDGVQINVSLPLAAHKRLRMESIRQGQPLAETLAGLIERHLPPA